jgi:multisubunit Na+/H+ antiporter MnhE subunit
LYASSITLTPGTFTIDIKDDDLLIIHAISCGNKNDKIDVVNDLKQMEDKIKSIEK